MFDDVYDTSHGNLVGIAHDQVQQFNLNIDFPTGRDFRACSNIMLIFFIFSIFFALNNNYKFNLILFYLKVKNLYWAFTDYAVYKYKVEINISSNSK